MRRRRVRVGALVFLIAEFIILMSGRPGEKGENGGGGRGIKGEVGQPTDSWIYRMRVRGLKASGSSEKEIGRGSALKRFNLECKKEFESLIELWKNQKIPQNDTFHIKISNDVILMPVRFLGAGPLKVILEYVNSKTGESCAIKVFVGPYSRIPTGYHGYLRLSLRERRKLKSLAPTTGFVELLEFPPYDGITEAFGWPCLIENVVSGHSLSEIRTSMQKRATAIKNYPSRPFLLPEPKNKKTRKPDTCEIPKAALQRLLPPLLMEMAAVGSVIYPIATILQACERFGYVVRWDKSTLSPLDVMIPRKGHTTLLDSSLVTLTTTKKPSNTSRRWPFPLNILRYKLISDDATEGLERCAQLYRKASSNKSIIHPSHVLTAVNFTLGVRLSSNVSGIIITRPSANAASGDS
ncbi:hypothetical protein AAMO2058_000534300 [Amorphochlora amoebiformis]